MNEKYSLPFQQGDMSQGFMVAHVLIINNLSVLHS